MFLIKSPNARLCDVVLLLAVVCTASTLCAQKFAEGDDSPPGEGKIPELVAAPARSQLDELLWRKIAYVDGICGLTDEQKKKLQLAGSGDVNHILERIAALRTKAQSGQIDAQFHDLTQESQSLKSLLITGPFDKPSLFEKTRRRLLTAEQLAKLDADGMLFSSAWITDLGEAQDLSRKHNRRLLVHFHADWSAPCCQMKSVLYKPNVIRFLHDHFIPVFIEENRDGAKRVMRQYGVVTVPSDLVLNPDGDVVGRSQGARTEQAVMEMLQSAAGSMTGIQPATLLKAD